MTETVCAIVPLKVDSRRLPNKNFLYLDGRPLAHHIIETLLDTAAIDTVYAFCSNSQLVDLLPGGVVWLPRPDRLDENTIQANELFSEAVKQVTEDIVVLAQAPGPFVTRSTVEQCIEAVRASDSQTALTVQRHQTYAWFQGAPLNFDPADIAQTQQIEPVFTESSGIYAFHREFFIETGRRVSSAPIFVEVGDLEATDIDTAEDFKTAEILATGRRTHRSSPSLSDERRTGGALGSDPKIRHISFDLDGVLVDSINVMKRAWDAAAAENSVDLSFEEYRRHIGLPFEEILDRIGVPVAKRAKVTTTYESTAALLSDEVPLFPGVFRGMEKLASSDYAISIVTSKSRERARNLVDGLLPDCIGSLVCGDDSMPARGKPHPDPLLHACISLQADPNETVYVGDMLPDLQCANRAGVTYVHAGWGYGGLGGFSRLWFDSFQNLVDWLVRS